MKTSILSKHQFLKSQLLELVEVSNLVEQQDRLFVLKFDQWLKTCEGNLKDLGFSEASFFSVYRSEIFNCKNKKERNKQKLVFAKSIECIKLAQQTLYNLFHPFDQKITQAEEILENILVLIESSPDFKKINRNNFSLYVNNVWGFITKQEVFQNHVNQLKLTTSITDVKLLLGQKLPV